MLSQCYNILLPELMLCRPIMEQHSTQQWRTWMKCEARHVRCARAVQLGHSSQLDLAGSSHTAQRTASLAASRASLGSSSAASSACSPATRLHQRMHLTMLPLTNSTPFRQPALIGADVCTGGLL